MSDSLQPLFRPNRLAVIGASAKPGKLGFTIFKNILDAGFGGQVIPVNPKGETILGVPSVKSVQEIPSGTDLAVVIIPAPSVAGPFSSSVSARSGRPSSSPEGSPNRVRTGLAFRKRSSRTPRDAGFASSDRTARASTTRTTTSARRGRSLRPKGAMAIASQSGTVGAALSTGPPRRDSASRRS